MSFGRTGNGFRINTAFYVDIRIKDIDGKFPFPPMNIANLLKRNCLNDIGNYACLLVFLNTRNYSCGKLKRLVLILGPVISKSFEN